MKKLFSVILAVVMVLSLAACGSSSAPASSSAAESAASSEAAAPEAFAFKDSITVIVPFKAGSATDNQLRLMQPALEKQLGVSLVIVNDEGGSGTIGTTDFLNNYAADGYTIEYSLATPIVYKPLGGDTAYTYDDLTPVALTSSLPMYLIMSDDSSFGSAEEVLEYIKANPGEFTYANVGNGGNGHLAFASFLNGEGLDATSVPYSGGTADCYTAMMGGEVNAAVYGEADLLAREGNHGVINLGSKSSVEALKDVPTLSDLGYSGYETNNMAGFFYAAGVPQECIDTFGAAVEAILSDEAVVAECVAAGFTPKYASAAELDAMARQVMETALPVIQALNG